MDRRAFMALLGLGPAFKRLVPKAAATGVRLITVGPMAGEIGHQQRDFYRAIFTLHMSEHCRYVANHGIAPCATLPEREPDATP